MLELIFQGFVEWSYGLVLECWEYFSGVLLDILSMDFTYLRTHVPVVDTIMQIMLAVGWALLLGNLVFQSLKSMVSGLGFEGEDPKLLFTRTFVFAFLLLASPQICRMGLNMTQTVIDILQIPDAVVITFADESIFGGIGAAWILVIIIGIIVMFKVFGLILEIAERYVILGMLTICAPLAFGVGGSRNTSDIFTGWCRMFASMCFMMVSNVIFFKMLLSVLSFVPTGLDVLPWMVLVLTIAKVAKKVDAIIARIGLNPAITGGHSGRSLPGMLAYSVIRAATKQVVQTAGKNTGGGTRGASGKTPPGGGSGGGPKTGNPTGSGYSGNRTQHTGQTPGAQAASGQNTSAQQSGTAQPGGQNASAVFHASQQNETAQQEPSARQSTPWAPEQPGSTRPGAGSRVKENPGFGNPVTKQSAVPPGARRAASHVRQTGSGMAGTAAASSAGQAGQRAGTPSGTAGMGTSGIASRPGKTAQGSGAPAAAQGHQRDSGTVEARYTSRPSSAPGSAPDGTAGTGAAHPQPAAASAAFSATAESASRHGRNAAQAVTSGPIPANTAAAQQTARQERASSMSGTIPGASGTAGMSGRVSGDGQQKRPMSQTTERARSSQRPTAAVNSKKLASGAAIQQEKGQTSQRQSGRKQQGGAERGK